MKEYYYFITTPMLNLDLIFIAIFFLALPSVPSSPDTIQRPLESVFCSSVVVGLSKYNIFYDREWYSKIVGKEKRWR